MSEPLLECFVFLLGHNPFQRKTDAVKTISFVIEGTGGREGDVGRCIVAFLIVVIDPDYLIHGVSRFDILADGVCLAEEYFSHAGAQYNHFPFAVHVQVIDETTILGIYIDIIDIRMIGIDTTHLSCDVFLFKVERIRMGNSGRNLVDLRMEQLDRCEVLFLEFQAPVGRHSFPGKRGVTGPYLYLVHGHVPEVEHHTVA